ncbi:phage virion morphogenesis protein [Chroococcidiopsis sp.]|uniref:phage virion morphogenesis protein n=1 Tax=Chroococcidiopsis sp. TaxID=3088168 RepID=UPI003F30A461
MLKITVDDSQLQAAFARLRQRSQDLRAPMSDIGEYTLRRVDDGFRKEQSFYGVPWQPLKPRTIKQKQKKRQILKVLQATGTFRASFSYDAGTDFVEVGSNRVGKNGVSIGLLHQLGSRRMPARPTLPDANRGLPPADTEEILSILEEHIISAW